jgi:hypothetical protein
MEIDDETIRRIIREAMRELGAEADPALLRKIVREVIRELEREEGSAHSCDCHEESA